MKDLRILSLLPAATEMVYALGLGKQILGISDDSDYPKEVAKLPRVVTSTLPQGLSSRQIDDHVRSAAHSGISIFHIDKNMISKLAPNLVISQEICEVCAIGTGEIRKAARILQKNYKLISLEPESVEDILENIRLIGSETKTDKQAETLIARLLVRIDLVKSRTKNLTKPSVLIIEWVDPLMIAGHWAPEMVEIAGGEHKMVGKQGKSKRVTWEEIQKIDPDILIIAPCGFDISRAQKETKRVTERSGFEKLKAAKKGKVFFVDGNAYIARPGPRIIDGSEILAEIFHPQQFPKTHLDSDWIKV